MTVKSVRSTDDQHSIVQNGKYPFHFGREIHVSRRIHQDKLFSVNRKKSLFGENGDSPLTLFFFMIKKAVPVVHAAGFSDHSAIQ